MIKSSGTVQFWLFITSYDMGLMGTEAELFWNWRGDENLEMGIELSFQSCRVDYESA